MLAALALALRESPRRGQRRGTRLLRETPAVQTPPCGCLPPAAQRLRGGAPSIMLSRVGARPGPSTLRGASAAGRSESSSCIACAIVPCSSDYMHHVRACCACAAWRRVGSRAPQKERSQPPQNGYAPIRYMSSSHPLRVPRISSFKWFQNGLSTECHLSTLNRARRRRPVRRPSR